MKPQKKKVNCHLLGAFYLLEDRFFFLQHTHNTRGKTNCSNIVSIETRKIECKTKNLNSIVKTQSSHQQLVEQYCSQ